MNQNDFTVYKEGGDVLSMGFKINSIIAKQGLPVMAGGNSPFNQNKFNNLNVPLPLAVLHRKASDAAHESMSGGNPASLEIKNVEVPSGLNVENIFDNQQIDDLIFDKLLALKQLGGAKKYTKSRKRKSKNKTRKIN